jgi:tape measure domain-containing protein
MADEVYRLEIPIEVRDESEQPVRRARDRMGRFAKDVGALERAATKTERAITKLGRAKVSPTIKANDETKRTIDAIHRSLTDLTRKSWHVTVGVRSAVGAGLNGIRGSLRAATSMPAMIGGAIAGGAVGALGAHAVGLASDLEGATIGFATMFQAADKAAGGVGEWNAAMQQSTTFLNEIQDFANKTPFEFPELRSSAQRLMAFGFSAKSILPMMTAIGDASAGLNLGTEGVNRLTTALGQMKAKGRVQGDEILQLTEAGIPALKILGEGFNMTELQMSEAITKGIVPANKSIRLLLEGIEKRFPDAMARQAKTTKGMWSTIKDTFNSRLATPLGEGLIAGVKPAMERLTGWLDSPEGGASIKSWGLGLKNLGSTVSSFITGVVQGPMQDIGRFFASPEFMSSPDKLGLAMGKAFDYIVTHSGPLGEWLVWFRDKGWPGIKGAAEGFWTFVQEKAIPFATDLSGKIGDIANWLREANDTATRLDAWKNLSGAWSDLVTIGGSLVGILFGKSSLAQGFDESGNSAKNAGEGFAAFAKALRELTDGFRKLMQYADVAHDILSGNAIEGFKKLWEISKTLGRGFAQSWQQGDSLTIAQGSRANGNLSPILKAAGFTEEQIAAACGPIAAAGIGRAFGLATDPSRMLSNASQYGWSKKGMGGTAAFQKMLEGELGIKTTSATSAQAIAELQAGGIAAVSTAEHYFLAQGYNPATGEVDVGNTGASIWGKRWMTPTEIEQRGGGGAAEWLLPTLNGRSARMNAGAGERAAGGGSFATVGEWARIAGLDAEGQKVAMAIAKTEGAFPDTSKVGDKGSGGSYSLYQFHRKGQLANFARAMGLSLDDAAKLAQDNPQLAAMWALGSGGYLGDAIREGQSRGYHGADLAWYAQEHGQRSKPEGFAASKANYQSMFGDAAASNADMATGAYRSEQGLPAGDVGYARGGPLAQVNLGVIGLDDEGAQTVALAVQDLVAGAIATNLPHILANVRKRRGGQ